MRRVVVISHTYVDPANRGKLRALAARGLDVTVGVPRRWREPAFGRVVETSWERQAGVEVFPIPARAGGDPARMRLGRRELAALLRDKRPDLIQIEEEPTSPAAAQTVNAARKLSIPAVVFTTQNLDVRLPLLVRWRRRRTLGRLSGERGKGKGEGATRGGGVIAGSKAAAAAVQRDAPGVPVTVIPQLGVQVPAAPQHLPHEGLAIGYVGRLVPRKGLDTLLRALALVRGERWQLTVVGDGPAREALEHLATELRLAARIRWAGALPSDLVPRIWPELDVLVVPSRSLASWNEPVGTVLVEAMTHEVAVVGSDAGVTPEVIGDAGVVVPADDPRALADALRRLQSEAVRRPLAQAARARAMREYSDDAVAERTLEFWRELLAVSH